MFGLFLCAACFIFGVVCLTNGDIAGAFAGFVMMIGFMSMNSGAAKYDDDLDGKYTHH